MSRSIAVVVLVLTVTLGGMAAATPPPGGPGGTGLVGALRDATGGAPVGMPSSAPIRSLGLARAAEEATRDLRWLAMDMHLHTDHSSDGGLFHQQEKDQRNQDTFLGEQRDQALRTGMDAIAFTDHRVFGQHYDPDYDLVRAGPLATDQVLLTGEEWGGGRHGTAFGIRRVLEHGPTNRTGCGMAEMTLEAAAQDALLGLAHPKDGGADACMVELLDFPLSHVEALRGGDNVAQEAGVPLGGGNGSNTAYYQRLLAAGGRVAAVNGSDNHFKQVWAGPSGPGGSATHLLVADRSEAGIVEAVRAGRTVGGWGAASIRLTTLLDVDVDGAFDAVTGGWALPTGPTVLVALRVEQGAGHTVQVWDDAGALVGETAITLADETVAFALPATSAFYRATASTVALSQVGLPDPLDYVDTLVMSSTPVWTTAPTSSGVVPSAVAGPPVGVGAGDWSGFADLAAGEATTLHLVMEQRTGVVTEVVHRRSDDGGLTWAPSTVLATGGRSPAVAAAGDLVVVAYEAHDPQRFGGDIVVLASHDGGRTFGQALAVAGNAARPDVAIGAGDAVHVVWQQQVEDGTWAIHHQRLGDAGPRRLSHARPFSGGMTRYAVPPRELLHIPVSVEPVIAVSGDAVAVGWEDNRQDQTPGRSDSPDDWGIFGAVSRDGGLTFEEDVRWTPRRLRREDLGNPEGVQGNPALMPSLAFGPGGVLHLAFTDTVESAGYSDVWAQRSEDGGRTWEAPVRVAPPGEWAHDPQVVVGADTDVAVVWQQAADPTWSLVRARSDDGGRTFGAAEPVTDGGRYAGWPSVAAGVVGYTAEAPAGFGVHVARLPDQLD